jgi:hypothetical protein
MCTKHVKTRQIWKKDFAALHHDSSAAKQLTQYSKLQTLHCIHCVSKLRGGAPPRRNSPSFVKLSLSLNEHLTYADEASKCNDVYIVHIDLSIVYFITVQNSSHTAAL